MTALVRERLSPAALAECAQELAQLIHKGQQLAEDHDDRRKAMRHEKADLARQIGALAEVIRTGLERGDGGRGA